MRVSEMIKLLTDIEVNTDDLKLLRESPEKHVSNIADIPKLEHLFNLIDETIRVENGTMEDE